MIKVAVQHGARATAIGFLTVDGDIADDKVLVTGSMDTTVRLWDVARRKETATLEGTTGEVLCVAKRS
jgi:WD40 repeat protein